MLNLPKNTPKHRFFSPVSKVFKSISLLSVQLFLQPTTPVPIKIALLSFQRFQRPSFFPHFSTLFSQSQFTSSTESTFPPGPNGGVGSPLNGVVLLDGCFCHNPVVQTAAHRCKLLKSIFHLHTLVLTSLFYWSVPLGERGGPPKIFAPFNVPQKIAIDKPSDGGWNRRNYTNTEIELSRAGRFRKTRY